MNVFKRKKILIKNGEVFRWKKGLKLKAIEKSTFCIPGTIFQDGIRICDIMELSDNETLIMVMEETPKEDRYPDIAIILNNNTTMKLNRNCEVILTHLKGEICKSREFIIVEGNA